MKCTCMVLCIWFLVYGAVTLHCTSFLASCTGGHIVVSHELLSITPSPHSVRDDVASGYSFNGCRTNAIDSLKEPKGWFCVLGFYGGFWL